MNEWTIKDSGGLWGSTDHGQRTISAPIGSGYIARAIRAHEILHAWKSNPTKPEGHEESFSWLEEARIDFLVSKIGQQYHTGITDHRKQDIDRWVMYGDTEDPRLQAKAVLVGRGYRMSQILKEHLDRQFVGSMIRQVAEQPSYDKVAQLAVEFDEYFPPDDAWTLMNVNMGMV